LREKKILTLYPRPDMAFSEYPIHVDQLCVGLHVRIEPDEADIPALIRGVKIKNDAQVAKIKSLGVKHVICVLNKSDRLPLPLGFEDLKRAVDEQPKKFEPGQSEKTPVSRQLFGLKQETIERNKDRREQFARCEKRYDTAVGQVSQLLRRVSGRSNEAVGQAMAVVGALVDTFLSERDVFVNLMTSKPKEDKAHLHAFNVTVLSMMLGKELQFDGLTMQYLGMGSLFHDVGKGRVPVNELSMGRATSLKYAVLRYYEQHPRQGAKIVSELPEFPQQAAHVILQHHETVDGKGFPNKLHASKISPMAKIVAVANAYDNLCNRNDEGEDYTPHEALKYMFTKMRDKLDNRYLAMFIRNLGVYPPGSIVQLSNGALGMVVSTNLQKTVRPSIMLYHPDVPKKEALIVDLVVEEELEIKKAFKPDELSREVLGYLSPSRSVNYYAEVMGDAK
jgi:HD-GYP domain-containing protein (c-di-GMP phosphodiesterase class II)